MDNKIIDEIKRRGVPRLGAQEDAPDPIMYMEMCLWQFPWKWYVSECEIEPDDVLFYGLTSGYYNEWGYFRLSELEAVPRPLMVFDEFEPKPLSEVKKSNPV